jgi:uncharacterized protein (DUF305 family)
MLRRACLAGSLLILAAGASAHEGHPHPPQASTATEQPFLRENEAAMARMMQAMDIPPTGDIDRDFVAMMTPHHQGAIDMATALLRHGGNERLRRLAQEIIVTQQDEIAAMRLAIGAPLPPSVPAPTQVAPAAASVR